MKQPFAARTQQPMKAARIGFSRPELLCYHGSSCRKNVEDFATSAGRGQNIVIESRWAETTTGSRAGGRVGSSQCRRSSDLWDPGVLAAKQATTIIPIVMVVAPTRSDPASSPASAGPVEPHRTNLLCGAEREAAQLLRKRFRKQTHCCAFQPTNPAPLEMMDSPPSRSAWAQQFEARRPDELKGRFRRWCKKR
jgi:hypothetical protein